MGPFTLLKNAVQVGRSEKVNRLKSANKKMVDEAARATIPVTDLDRYISTLSDCKPLSEAEIRLICEKAREIFYNESNVQPVKCPVTVVGDLYFLLLLLLLLILLRLRAT